MPPLRLPLGGSPSPSSAADDTASTAATTLHPGSACRRLTALLLPRMTHRQLLWRLRAGRGRWDTPTPGCRRQLSTE